MKSQPSVTISLINYNERKFIFKAIESIVSQTYPNLEIIITDNASTDGTREEIEKMIPGLEGRRREVSGSENSGDLTQNVVYIKNETNTGFGRPHNQAIRIGRGDIIVLLNADLILAPNFIEEGVKAFADEKVGAVQPKLLRYNFDKDEIFKDLEDPTLNRIDTVGLQVFKNRRIVCIGQGTADRGQFDEPMEIFGSDGAAPFFRKAALEDIKLPILELKGRKKINEFEYFDEDFFMYKEDVDLAWRLRLNGWKALYNPNALAYHGRGSGDSMAKNYIKIIQERRKINPRAKYYSFLHQRLMQIKDDYPELLFKKHFKEFIVKEIGAWGYMMIFERFTFRLAKDFYRLVPLFVKKRKLIMAKAKVSPEEIAKWFV